MRINKILILIFLLMVFSSVVSILWFLQIDGIVKTLDKYGAIYDSRWLGPYSKLTVIAFGLLVANTAAAWFGLISRVKPRLESKPMLTRLTCIQDEELTSLEILSRSGGKRFVCDEAGVIPVEVEPKVIPVEVEEPEEPQIKTEENQVQVEEPTPKLESAVAITCPNCMRVFGRPLVVLDFSNDTYQLINVCPYCRQPLQDSNGRRGKQNE